MTCVMPRSRSSATEASWYVAVPSGRSRVVPSRPSRTDPSSSRTAAPVASARSAASAYTSPRSLCRTGPSSKPTPSQERSASDRLLPALDVARRIGVVDPQHHDAAVRVGEAPVGDCGQRVPEMERARRAGSEADADRHGLRVDRNVAGLRGDALEPRARLGVRLEVEAALVRDVRVRVERDVRERVALADEERPSARDARSIASSAAYPPFIRAGSSASKRSGVPE